MDNVHIPQHSHEESEAAYKQETPQNRSFLSLDLTDVGVVVTTMTTEGDSPSGFVSVLEEQSREREEMERRLDDQLMMEVEEVLRTRRELFRRELERRRRAEEEVWRREREARERTRELSRVREEAEAMQW